MQTGSHSMLVDFHSQAKNAVEFDYLNTIDEFYS